jgi:hypothetical protein
MREVRWQCRFPGGSSRNESDIQSPINSVILPTNLTISSHQQGSERFTGNPSEARPQYAAQTYCGCDVLPCNCPMDDPMHDNHSRLAKGIDRLPVRLTLRFQSHDRGRARDPQVPCRKRHTVSAKFELKRHLHSQSSQAGPDENRSPSPFGDEIACALSGAASLSPQVQPRNVRNRTASSPFKAVRWVQLTCNAGRYTGRWAL